MGQRRHNIFCAVLNCGEIFLLSPPSPLCDPKFYPFPRVILGGTSLFEAFFPPVEKSRCPYVLGPGGVPFWRACGGGGLAKGREGDMHS